MSNYLQLLYCKKTEWADPNSLQAGVYHSNGRAYAIVFDPVTGKAIQTGGVGVTNPMSLATFDQNNQGNFAFFLNNDRLYCYSAHISGPTISLPDNDYGEFYLVEYWVESASGTVAPNRFTDYFVDTERFIWLQGRRVDARLDSSEDQNIANLTAAALPHIPIYCCFAAIAFDSVTNRTGLTAWLEKDNQVQTGAAASNAIITIYDSTGTVFINKHLNTQLPGGQFVDQVLNAVPSPDETYFGEVQITDGSGVTHTTGLGIVTWD